MTLMPTNFPSPLISGTHVLGLLLLQNWQQLQAWQGDGLPDSPALVYEVRTDKAPGRVIIAGSVHALPVNSSSLPAELLAAYTASDLVVFEVDPSALDSHEFKSGFAHLSRLPAGTTLEKTVQPATWKRLTDFFAQCHNAPQSMTWRFMQPWALALSIQQMQLQSMGVHSIHGIESQLHEMIKNDGRPIDALESTDRQLELLMVFAELDPDTLINETLNQLDTASDIVSQLEGQWREGSIIALYQTIRKSLPSGAMGLEQQLLAGRNHLWLPQIESFMTREGTTLVVVGAGHLTGPDNLLHLLNQRGYSPAPFNMQP